VAPSEPPHDWAIEGPFSHLPQTTGPRGLCAVGNLLGTESISTLPEQISGRRVFIESTASWRNGTVYVKRHQARESSYGYVTFRYDMTAKAKFGTAENVIAVKTDTSLQPASRSTRVPESTRHVRIIATDPSCRSVGHIRQHAAPTDCIAPSRLQPRWSLGHIVAER